MTQLEKLAAKYGTDKLAHGYIPFYEATLPQRPIRMLEIGCYKGASARMWRDYLPAGSEIHALDLFVENPIPNDIPGVTFHKGSQIDYEVLDKLRNYKFDVIIDDGSHNSRDQMITFFGLMHAGCDYYIEDLHCCNQEFYRDGLPFKFTADNLFRLIPAGITTAHSTKNIILISK